MKSPDSFACLKISCASGNKPTRRFKIQALQGFTLPELMVVIFTIGILISIMAMGWLGFVDGRRLSNAQAIIYNAMRTAQTEAKQEYSVWQASFRVVEGSFQWAVHAASDTPRAGDWQNFGQPILIDVENTTLYQDKSQDLWRVQFNRKGHVNGRLGRITVIGANGGKAKRCVFASTLLGALRLDEDKRCRK